MRILLVNDTSDWCHWGCTGTSSMLKEKMEKLNCELSPISARETYRKAWECRPDTLEEFKDSTIFKSFCQKNLGLISRIKASDALIINGEGTIHGLKAAPLNLLYLAYISKVFFHKHVEIINHSVYPEDSLTLKDNQTKSLYRAVYQELDYVAVREPLSLELLKKLGIKATLSFDCLPLYIKEHYQLKEKIPSKNLVIAGSADWQETNMLPLVNYINFMSQQRFKIILLIGAKSYTNDDSKMVTFLDDNKIVEFFEKHLSKIEWQLVDAKSMDEWLDTIANATFLVSGRFHHSIAASCLGTPLIALNSNTPKLDGFMQILEMPPTLQYNDKNLFNKLIKKTEKILSKSHLQNSNKIMSKLCELAENNFYGLKKLRELSSQINETTELCPRAKM